MDVRMNLLIFSLFCLPFILWWLAAAYVLKDIAWRRGNSPNRFFWIGMIFGPIIGAVFLIAMPREDRW